MINLHSESHSIIHLLNRLLEQPICLTRNRRKGNEAHLLDKTRLFGPGGLLSHCIVRVSFSELHVGAIFDLMSYSILTTPSYKRVSNHRIFNDHLTNRPH